MKESEAAYSYTMLLAEPSRTPRKYQAQAPHASRIVANLKSPDSTHASSLLADIPRLSIRCAFYLPLHLPVISLLFHAFTDAAHHALYLSRQAADYPSFLSHLFAVNFYLPSRTGFPRTNLMLAVFRHSKKTKATPTQSFFSWPWQCHLRIRFLQQH